MERQAEQTALAAAGDPPSDIEERALHQCAVLDQPDPARLFDDEQPPAAVTGIGDVERGVEPVTATATSTLTPDGSNEAVSAGRRGW